MDLVVQTIQTEQKRRNKAYQLRVILSVGKFIKEFPDQRDLVESYIEIVRQVLTDDYLEEADIITDTTPLATEDLFLSYIRSVVEACPLDAFDEDLFTFALELMREFKKVPMSYLGRLVTHSTRNFQGLLKFMEVGPFQQTAVADCGKRNHDID